MEDMLRSSRGNQRAGGLDGARAVAQRKTDAKSDVGAPMPAVRSLASTSGEGAKAPAPVSSNRFMLFEDIAAKMQVMSRNSFAASGLSSFETPETSLSVTSAPLGRRDEDRDREKSKHADKFGLPFKRRSKRKSSRSRKGKSKGRKSSSESSSSSSGSSSSGSSSGSGSSRSSSSGEKRRASRRERKMAKKQAKEAAHLEQQAMIDRERRAVEEEHERRGLVPIQALSSASGATNAASPVMTIDASKLGAWKAPTVQAPVAAPASDAVADMSASIAQGKGIKRAIKAVTGRKSRSDYILYAQDDPTAPVATDDLASFVDSIDKSTSVRARELSALANRSKYEVISQAVGSEPLSIRSGGQSLIPRNINEAPLKYRPTNNNPPWIVVHYAGVKGGVRKNLFRHEGRSRRAKKEQRAERWIGQPVIITFRSPVDRKKYQAILAANSLVVSDTNVDAAARARVYYARYTGSNPAYPKLVVLRFGQNDWNATWNDLVLVYDNAAGTASFNAANHPLIGSELGLVEALSSLVDSFVGTSTASVPAGTSAIAMLNSLIVEPAFGDALNDAPFAQTYAGALSACVRCHADATDFNLDAVDKVLRNDMKTSDAVTAGSAADLSRIMADVASDMRALNLSTDEMAARAGLVYEAVFRHIDAAGDLFGESRSKMTETALNEAQRNLETLAMRCLAHTCSHLVLKSGAPATTLAALWGAKSGKAVDAFSVHFNL